MRLYLKKITKAKKGRGTVERLSSKHTVLSSNPNQKRRKGGKEGGKKEGKREERKRKIKTVK
jgi:hypothetical protein